MVDQDYRKAEYDAFGPWIFEISDAHPLPPLFAPRFVDEDNSLMRIKIPRDIERRNANPDMDLYDYVIALYDDRARILERVDSGVRETEIPYADIEGLENFVDHLSARLTVYAGGRALAVPYNAVSEPIVNDMMRVIRSRYAEKEFAKMRSPYTDPERVIEEVIFANLLNKARANEEGFSIAAIQPTIKLRNASKSIGRRALQALIGKSLLGSIHLTNGREALVLGRGKPFKTKLDVVYSRSYFYVPTEKIRSVDMENDARYGNLAKLSLNTDNHRFEFYVNASNAEAAAYRSELGDLVGQSPSKR